MNAMTRLLDFLKELDAAGHYYRLSRPRDEAIMVEVAVPGQRWEIEFFPDGHVETEEFRSTPDGVQGEDGLARFWRDNPPEN